MHMYEIKLLDLYLNWPSDKTCISFTNVYALGKLEKEPRGVQGEKSSKDMVSSRNLVSTIGAQANHKKWGQNQVSGRAGVPCWHATPVANAPWKPLIIRWKSSSVSRSWNWWKVGSVWTSLLVKGQNFVYHSWEGEFELLNKIPVSTIKLLNDDFKRSKRYPCYLFPAIYLLFTELCMNKPNP